MKGALQTTEIAAGTAIHAHALPNQPPRSHLHPDGATAREELSYATNAIPPTHRSYTAARGAGVDANRPARATPTERRRRRNREGGASEITSKEARRCANLKASGGTCEARNEREEAARDDHFAAKPRSFFSSQRQARQAHVWKRSIPRRHAQRQERKSAAHRPLGR